MCAAGKPRQCRRDGPETEGQKACKFLVTTRAVAVLSLHHGMIAAFIDKMKIEH